MSNSTASVRITIAAGSRSVSETIAPTYNGLSDGVLDLPALAASGTVLTVPFGSIGVGASLLWIKNKTGQECILKLNGSLAIVNVPDGAGVLITSAALPASTKLTAATLTTTAEAAQGTVEYMVLGDPV